MHSSWRPASASASAIMYFYWKTFLITAEGVHEKRTAFQTYFIYHWRFCLFHFFYFKLQNFLKSGPFSYALWNILFVNAVLYICSGECNSVQLHTRVVLKCGHFQWSLLETCTRFMCMFEACSARRSTGAQQRFCQYWFSIVYSPIEVYNSALNLYILESKSIKKQFDLNYFLVYQTYHTNHYNHNDIIKCWNPSKFTIHY